MSIDKTFLKIFDLNSFLQDNYIINYPVTNLVTKHGAFKLSNHGLVI